VRDFDRPFRALTPGFADLMLDAPYRDIFDPPADPLAVLNYYHVRYVLFYSGEVPDNRQGQFRAALRRVLQQPAPELVSEDRALEAWRVPPVEPAGPFLRTDTGWYPIENWEGLGLGRWMGAPAQLYLERPQPVPVTISFVAVSFAKPRRLEVRADDQPVGVFTIAPDRADVTLQLPAARGTTRLLFRSLDGADTPSALTGARDNRSLSIGLTRVRVAVGSGASSALRPPG
jgi:hypothetical protein